LLCIDCSMYRQNFVRRVQGKRELQSAQALFTAV
jgi:hypothetical protein